MKEDNSSANDWKNNYYGMASSEAGGQAEAYIKITKSIGEYVGEKYGREMRILVLTNHESDYEKPKYPGESAGDELKAIWKMDYDFYLKKLEKYAENKSK
eukprot:scaffold2627_cov107-Cylindrotheca_fusiformis.AAC.1